MIQSFRRIKIDPNDALYSKIIRHGKIRCERCLCVRDLQCAHIMPRGHHRTRYMLKPYKNAVALCCDCHNWFDTHRDDTPIFEVDARRFYSPLKNAYTFLVFRCGYTWLDLHNLYALAHHGTSKYGVIEKTEVGRQLKEVWKQINKESV